ncbi:LPXTG cell wall anchor domain-containing protein [Lactococcus lactis subsp. lactis]|uniref:LPXTG cell wall anchor domain-containing protein n=1 Tax=Lactococcus lactis TaxID=1358 RepID=UPI0007AE92A4|nr:LPXTG cell wall anchor domain-containing protein [Lactococcus lactis]KZK12185.1 hypothetical protein DRA4_1362 [Lactococcus lactis subsp. lactis bv. diacetylactis]WKK99608.1 LPXTG cell wall anchor domain-containing protein [Lactococcus lactis subsp. lactis]
MFQEEQVVDPDGTIHLPNGEVINPDGTVSGKNSNTPTPNNSGSTSGSTAKTLSSNSGFSTLNSNNTTLPKTGDDSMNSAEAIALGISALLGVMTLTEVKRRKEN